MAQRQGRTWLRDRGGTWLRDRGGTWLRDRGGHGSETGKGSKELKGDELGEELRTLPRSLSEETVFEVKRTSGMFLLHTDGAWTAAVPLSTACTFNKHLLQMPSCLVQRENKKYPFGELFSGSFWKRPA